MTLVEQAMALEARILAMAWEALYAEDRHAGARYTRALGRASARVGRRFRAHRARYYATRAMVDALG